MDQKGIRLDDIKGDGNGTVQSGYVKDEEYLATGTANHVEPKYHGTAADQRDMSVLGREQVLRASKHRFNRLFLSLSVS